MSLLGALVCFVAISADPEVELLHFEAPGCVHCRTMEPVVARLAKSGAAIRHIDASEDPDAAAQYEVRGVPCFIVLVNGVERDRHEGVASFDRLQSMLVQARRAVTGDDEFTSFDAEADSRREPPKAAARPKPRRNWRSESDERPAQASRPQPPRTQPRNEEPEFISQPSSSDARPAVALAALSPAQVRQQALNATVRIRIEDRPGVISYGTGTIIDARDGHALVITCGHLFRDSGKQGRITVDAIVDGAKKTVEGRVLDYDLDYEIGLVVISPSGSVETARVADASGQPEPGQPLFSVGCNGGADPTIMEMQVTAIDRFTGAPNVECTGSPVQGRSGGGLFNEEGQLVAICFGALANEERGAYSGLPTIHWALDKHNLSEIYKASGPPASPPPPPRSIAQNSPAEMEADDEDPPLTADASLPEAPLPLPRRTPSNAKPAGRLVEVSNSDGDDLAADEEEEFTPPAKRTPPASRIADAKPSPKTRKESAPRTPPRQVEEKSTSVAETQPRSRIAKALDEHLASLEPGAEDAEVIIILNPKNAPKAKPKVLLLENPSREFLTRVAHERQAQEVLSNLPIRKPAPVARTTRSSGATIAMRNDDSDDRR